MKNEKLERLLSQRPCAYLKKERPLNDSEKAALLKVSAFNVQLICDKAYLDGYHPKAAEFVEYLVKLYMDGLIQCGQTIVSLTAKGKALVKDIAEEKVRKGKYKKLPPLLNAILLGEKLDYLRYA